MRFIIKHFASSHGTKPTREQLTENTSIIATATDRYRLLIKKALLIMRRTLSINKQHDNFTNILKLHTHRPVNLSATASQPNHYTVPPIVASRVIPLMPSQSNVSTHNTNKAQLHNQPFQGKDTELIHHNNTLSISPSSPSQQTVHTTNPDKFSNTTRPPKPHNSGNHPKNSLSNTYMEQSNHLTNEPSEPHKIVDTVLPAPILQESLNILPSAPPIYFASDEIEKFACNNAVNPSLQHSEHNNPNDQQRNAICSPRRLGPRRKYKKV